MSSSANQMDVEKDDQDFIDESLYSRQLYVYGIEAQKQLQKSNVLVIGVGGLGIEVAKDIALAGVNSLTIVDETPTTIQDLGAQFFLREEDVGKPRAQACINRLAELNNYVKTSASDLSRDSLDANFLKQFSVVVATDNRSSKTLIKIANTCRENNIAFIAAEARGVFGSIFVDFGDEFQSSDLHGEPEVTCTIAGISNEKKALISCVDDHRHGLETGMVVEITDVRGIPEINGKQYTVTFNDIFSFYIDLDTSSLGKYETGGWVKEVKQPTTLNFKSLQQTLENPNLDADIEHGAYGSYHQDNALFFAFSSLYDFLDSHDGQFPKPGNQQDIQEFVHLVKEKLEQQGGDIASLLESGDGKPENLEQLIETFASGCSAELVTVSGIIGGMVAQEALKAVSHKYTPLNQWYFYDGSLSIPKTEQPLSEQDLAPRGTRYDHMYAVFGKDFQDRIMNLKYFLVGSGAIGCEILKNWALMGIGCGPEGHIWVTDLDTIEKSNLNRQFLFRSQHVNSLKSEVAAQVITEMNKDMKITPMSDAVGVDTEEIFNDAFMDNLDGVCNALDNKEARFYMDARCIYYRKPMLDSGTLGTKGNTQVVVPFLTEAYGSSRDPPENQTPSCTIKNFPNQIEHTLQWARSQFQEHFHDAAYNVNEFIDNPDFIDQEKNVVSKRKMIEGIVRDTLDQRATSYEDCIVWARNLFEENYANQIKRLLAAFPADKEVNGVKFWTSPKRCPTPLQFDPSNDLHVDYIIATANLRAFMQGVDIDADRSNAAQIAANVNAVEFKPKEIKIKVNAQGVEEEEEEAVADEDVSIIQDMTKKLADNKDSLPKLNVSQFEKDDDTNFHMDFIVAASNLRATNYEIPIANKHKSKLIAGKITPAIATTTAVVSATINMELYKLYSPVAKTLEEYKNGFFNLAFSLAVFSDPMPPPAVGDLPGQSTASSSEEIEYTIWDRFDEDGTNGETLQEFLDRFTETRDLTIEMISAGSGMLYADFWPPKKANERLAMTIPVLFETVTKSTLPEHQKYLVLECAVIDKDDNEKDIPFVRYKFRE
eukprot:TRINITY_DN944_c0_g1_i8.p1 TRINITY_DN944_c0_g1~~TRINITY_DN944_c0_g1_i8.p1  ORF type:complete len:1082 (+),score=421.96 TRINITY_DN944_c0_g1_i8:96-3248(+)